MTEGKYYTVMELAEKVGVPRTTINDWLNKYAQYMDFIMQGKRRVYSENTFAILMKVSQLRSSGLPSFEIERELAKSFAIHPETAEETVHPVPEKENKTSSEEGVSQNVSPEVTSVSAQNTAAAPSAESGAIISVSASQNDEIALILGERFRDMLEKMDSLEKKAKSNTIRAWCFFALASILVILLALAGVYAYQYALKLERSNAGKDAALSVLSAKTEVLNAGNQAMHKQIESLQNGLDVQKKEFQSALKENRDNYEKRREAELAAQKDRFAAERLALLQKMENLQKENKAREAALKSAREEKERLLREKQNAELLRNPDFQLLIKNIPDPGKKAEK